ncbi:hypothetical protein [Echinimonas agarilytica]|uniref:Uncharacterized protein n=1 Tax=Echinimonas agarilytica TaxID=1215918 RepID=A0AA42B8Q7_9GAMM|nr:hypothetical protein [Echinimonas agarilytica]MCM2680783.1 hypothetical protein [Echinimonas agarilytica]
MNYFNQLSAEDKFVAATKTADYVFVGIVSRLYKLPYGSEGFQGAVIHVAEDLHGKAPVYVDAEFVTRCGISEVPDYQNYLYWPSQLDEQRVFAAENRNGMIYIYAAASVDEKTYYHSQLKLFTAAKEFDRREYEKEIENEEEILPEHLRIDHLKDLDDD